MHMLVRVCARGYTLYQRTAEQQSDAEHWPLEETHDI